MLHGLQRQVCACRKAHLHRCESDHAILSVLLHVSSKRRLSTQLTEIDCLPMRGVGGWCLLIFLNETVHQRGLDANRSGVPFKKSLLCRTANEQTACSYKLSAFRSTHKRTALLPSQRPDATKLVKAVATAV